MKEKIITIFFMMLLIMTVFATATNSEKSNNIKTEEVSRMDWYLQTSWDTSGLFSVFFSSNTVGWTGGIGTILHTSDGGNIWYEQDYPAASNIYNIFFVDNYIGWASGSFGVILHTTDGGNTWTEQDHDYNYGSYSFSGLYFFDANNGWAVGGKPNTYSSGAKRVILHTTDGGDTWITNLYVSDYVEPLSAVYFTDANNGWAVGGYDFNDGNILHTTDGGNSWVVQDYGSTNDLNDVFFTDSNNGWIVGDFGTLLHTINGGDTWLTENPGTSNSLTGMHFIDSQNGWLVGGNNDEATIIHTIDGGNTWNADNPGTTNFLVDIFLTDSTHGWAVGANGDIVSTILTSNIPPDQPFDPIPSDGETNVNPDPTLSVKVTDPNSDTMDVSFYDAANDSLIGTDTNVASGNRAYIIWNHLDYSTTYNWYAVADDGEDSTQSSTWSFTTTGVNQPPNQPTTPTGPTSLNVSQSGSYSTDANDPDGDQIQYRFDWDANGVHDYSNWSTLVPSGSTVNMSHAWKAPGTYVIKAQARDSNLLMSSFSSGLTIFVFSGGNQPPNTPNVSGPAQGKINVATKYNFTTTDPENNEVFYFIDWGDQTNSSWIGPYLSGDIIQQPHTWTKKGNYIIKGKAKDIFGNESDWGQLSVTMPYSINQPFMQFWEGLFERFPNAFPILRLLMGY